MNNKKIAVTFMVIVILILGSCLVYADEMDESIEFGEESDYIDVSSVTSGLEISGNSAVCKVRVLVYSTSNANKVVLTVNYLKSTGASIGTKTTTVYRTNNSFTGQTTKALSSHGTYHAKVNVKVYYNTQLIESFNVLTNNITY